MSRPMLGEGKDTYTRRSGDKQHLKRPCNSAKKKVF